MKQAYYFLNVVIPTEEDLKDFGDGLWPIVEVKLEVREELPTGQVNLGLYQLPLLNGGEEEEEMFC